MIGLLFTGGTISMTLDPATGAAAWLERPDIDGQVGALLAGDVSGANARLLQMVALGGTTTVAAAADVVRATTT